MLPNNKKLFGTDGIRGVANQHPMTAEVALSLGRALAYVFKNGQKPRILIGKDTRLSGYMLETAMAAGICSMGSDVLLVGPMPTPGIAFLTQSMRADAGVVISASHNSFYDNGIKIFDKHGFKLPDDLEKKIESLILSGEIDHHRPTEDEIGKAHRVDDAGGRYIEFAKSTFPGELSLDGVKIVLDCAHGASYAIAPTVLEELGAKVTAIGVEPDGKNINARVGAIHPQVMAARVRETGSHLGIALDGDADRVVFADEAGTIVDGDAILVLCAKELIKRGLLKNGTLATTVMSNYAIEESLATDGGTVVRSAVGDRYVVETMREKGLNFGGEASGHLIFLDHSTTGDGLVAALQVLAIMQHNHLPLSKLVSFYRPYPQILTNHKVHERKDLQGIPQIQDMVHEFKEKLGAKGRILIRYSGTEPLLRIMIEGPDPAIIRDMSEKLGSCVKSSLSL